LPALVVACVRRRLHSSCAGVQCWREWGSCCCRCCAHRGVVGWSPLFVYRVVGSCITVNLAIDFSGRGTHLSCICLVIAASLRRSRVVVFVVAFVVFIVVFVVVYIVASWSWLLSSSWSTSSRVIRLKNAAVAASSVSC
jgi:hypothetical protein